MKKSKDLAKVAKREQLFSTLAHKEGIGAAKRAKAEDKAGYKEAAKDSRWETKMDNKFARIREKKAIKARMG